MTTEGALFESEFVEVAFEGDCRVFRTVGGVGVAEGRRRGKICILPLGTLCVCGIVSIHN